MSPPRRQNPAHSVASVDTAVGGIPADESGRLPLLGFRQKWVAQDFGFLRYHHDEIGHVGFVPAADPAHALPIDVVSERDEFTEPNEFCIEFHLGHQFSDIHGSEPRNCQPLPRAEAVAVPGVERGIVDVRGEHRR